jgi:hypothetical protein
VGGEKVDTCRLGRNEIHFESDSFFSHPSSFSQHKRVNKPELLISPQTQVVVLYSYFTVF